MEVCMNAKDELQQLSLQATDLARRRGQLTNEKQLMLSELRNISPKVGENDLIEDPLDGNLAMQKHRLELRDRLRQLESDIAGLDAERQALEPALTEARAAVQHAEVEEAWERGRSLLAEAAPLGESLQTVLRKYEGHFSRCDAQYPMGEIVAGRLIPARCGLPLLSNRISTVLGELGWLLRQIAEFDPQCVSPEHPSSQAAAAELRFAASGVRSPIVESSDGEVQVEAKIAPAPDVEEVAAMLRRRTEKADEERRAVAAKL
jgi:hypothetical protein